MRGERQGELSVCLMVWENRVCVMVMLTENRVCVMVMLTQCVEKGRVSCLPVCLMV